MRRIWAGIKAGTFIFLITLLFTFAVPEPTVAWYQDTHEIMNEKSVDMFFEGPHNSTKYKNSPVIRASVADPQNYLGYYITSNSKFQNMPWSYYDGFLMEAPFETWVRRGGYSADEPHFWASVRHFYDPLGVSGGKTELTDHNWVHGWFYTAVCAREWAFSHEENPFSWKKALHYYKQAMEIPQDDPVTVVEGMSSGVSAFRDPDIKVKGPEEARKVYLAKSFRSLGETMHLMADMVCPPHVRNDSHPRSDPHEDSVRASETRKIFNGDYTGGKMVILDGVRNQLDGSGAEQMFHRLAIFTNGNFYSNDTIYDEEAGINPRNGEVPYPNPQLNSLDPNMFISEHAILGRDFEGYDIPMLQETSMSRRLKNMPLLWRTVKHPYYITPNHAIRQSALLIPLATYANTRLTDMLFPTLKLFHKKVAEVSSENEEITYRLSGSMLHDIDEDQEWKRMNMEPILYSGSGELMVKSDYGYTRKMADLIFSEGKLTDYKPFSADPNTADAEIIDIKANPLKFTYNKENSLYWTYDGLLLIPEGYSVYLEVIAGGRRFQSTESSPMVEFTGPANGEILITDDEDNISLKGLINLDDHDNPEGTVTDIKIYQYKHNNINAFILEEINVLSWDTGDTGTDRAFAVDCLIPDANRVIAILGVIVLDNSDELMGVLFPGSPTEFTATNDGETINWSINGINRIIPYGDPDKYSYIFEAPPMGDSRRVTLSASVKPIYWQTGNNYQLSASFREYREADGELLEGYYSRISDVDSYHWFHPSYPGGEEYPSHPQFFSVSLSDTYQPENHLGFRYTVLRHEPLVMFKEINVSLLPISWWNSEDIILFYLRTK